MKTKTYQVYKFSELSPSAQETAIRNAEIACGYAWGDEALESIKALAAHFYGKIKDWSISWDDCSRSSMDFDMPEMEREDIEKRLALLGTFDPKTGKGHGDCKLTAYSSDEDAIDGFRKAFATGEGDLGKLMDSAFETWIDAVHADYRAQYSPEEFAENCEVNGYEFTEDGRID